MARKILIVEDERLVAEDLAFCLRKLGNRVDIAYTGEDAIGMTRNNEYDVLLMDITLPGGIDGISAADRIHSDCLVPTVFMSALPPESVMKYLTKRPYFTQFVRKPFSDATIINAVEMAADGAFEIPA